MNAYIATTNDGNVLKRGDTVQTRKAFLTFAYVTDDGRIATQEAGYLPVVHKAGAVLDVKVHVGSTPPNGNQKLADDLVRFVTKTPDEITIADLKAMPWLRDLILAADDLSSRVDFGALVWAKTKGYSK